MMSPAKRHFMRVQAAAESAKAADSGVRPNASQYELMQAQLFEHRRRLKKLESIKAKAALKAELLPEYFPYIKGVLDADTGEQDDVIMTLLVWCIDASAWEPALAISGYAIKHGLALPDQYNRSTACVIAEEFAEASMKDGAELPSAILLDVLAIVAAQDMPDQVRAKLHKALGLALKETAPMDALNHLRTALSHDERSGVKTAITKLERELNTAPKA